jgi:hypothetical protein
MSFAEQSSQSKKRKKNTPCSGIITDKIFKLNFPDIFVPEEEICELKVPERWNFKGSEELLFQWLQATSVSIVSTSKLINRKNEQCLYPLVLDLIKPIVALSNDLVLRSAQPARDSEDIVAACEVVAGALSSKSSSLSGSPTTAAAVENEDEIFSPVLVDGTDVQQLAGLYIAIEKQLQNDEVTNKCRVELAVVQKGSNLYQITRRSKIFECDRCG